MTYYAYVHARPDTSDASGVFYVGKGMGGRSRPLPARNKHHGHVVVKHGAENILIGKLECSDEGVAFDLERGLIKCLQRMGVALTNQTDGGEGASGYSHSEEAKAKIAERSRQLAQDPEIQRRRSEATTKKNEAWQDPEYKARVSVAMRGKRKTPSPEALAARQANARKANTPEANAARAAASKARWADPEFKAKMAEKKRAAWADPIKRAKMLEGRSEGVSRSWKDEGVRNNRIRGIKLAANASKKEK